MASDNMTQEVARAIQASLEAQLFSTPMSMNYQTTAQALDFMAMARAAILAVSNYEPVDEMETRFYDN